MFHFILFILFIFIYRRDIFVGIFLVNLNDRAYNLQSMRCLRPYRIHAVHSRCARVNMHVIVNDEMRTQQQQQQRKIPILIRLKRQLPKNCVQENVCVLFVFFSFLKHFCFRCRLEIEQKPKIISFFVFVHLTTGPSISNVAIFEHQKFSTSRAHLFFYLLLLEYAC